MCGSAVLAAPGITHCGVAIRGAVTGDLGERNACKLGDLDVGETRRGEAADQARQGVLLVPDRGAEAVELAADPIELGGGADRLVGLVEQDGEQPVADVGRSGRGLGPVRAVGRGPARECTRDGIGQRLSGTRRR